MSVPDRSWPLIPLAASVIAMLFALAAQATAAEDTETPSSLMSPTEKITQRFMELDQDGNDGVSFDEYMAMVRQRAEERFQSMDADHDGEVSEEEFRAFWRARKAKWYRLKR